jgi:hypothetical protein
VRRPPRIVIVEHDARAPAANPRRAGGAGGRDDGRPASDRQLHGQPAGDAAGAMHQHPLAVRRGCGRCERLVRGERGHRERGRLLPPDDGRLPRDQRGRSQQPLRPRALVPKRHGVSEHLVARCQARHVLADRGDHTRRLDAQRQRRPAAHVPVADADELVPVGDPCRVHRDHDLVRRRRRRRCEFEHAQLAAERVDACGLHPSHRHHLRASWPSTPLQ